MSALRDVKHWRYLPPRRALDIATLAGVAAALLAMLVVICVGSGYKMGARDAQAAELAHRLAAADACRDDEVPMLVLTEPAVREADRMQCVGGSGRVGR